MTVLLDEHAHYFPDYDQADENGIIAVGGNFSPELLKAAYEAGIFPWPHEGLPLLWFFPDPRFVLSPREIFIDKSLRKSIKKSDLHIVADRDFLGVIRACQQRPRPEQNSTWITDDLIEGYLKLHRLGFAHSIEAYRDDRLVGGLYGVSIGTIFAGESMFYYESNASKICLVTLAAHLVAWHFTLIDCQMLTKTLAGFGAQPMSKAEFLASLRESQQRPSLLGPWQLHLSPAKALELLAPEL